MVNKLGIILQSAEINSELLQRRVRVDCFVPALPQGGSVALLLINDGQDMEALGLKSILDDLYNKNEIAPLLCVGIHAANRMMEYGTAQAADYKGRGNKASLYTRFIMKELLPYIYATYPHLSFSERSIAGFSMGGLSALDIAWNHPAQFNRVGVFSGSLWWRSRALDAGYDEQTDRIMHAQIKHSRHTPEMKFYFEAGTLDETMDRNNNGIIDAIDDTITLIDELEKKGYNRKKDIRYLELEGGRHNVATWAQAMPDFLRWGWGLKR